MNKHPHLKIIVDRTGDGYYFIRIIRKNTGQLITKFTLLSKESVDNICKEYKHVEYTQ